MNSDLVSPSSFRSGSYEALIGCRVVGYQLEGRQSVLRRFRAIQANLIDPPFCRNYKGTL